MLEALWLTTTGLKLISYHEAAPEERVSFPQLWQQSPKEDANILDWLQVTIYDSTMRKGSPGPVLWAHAFPLA